MISTESNVSVPLRIEIWAIARFVPYARNPRKNDHAVERMAASIREFGFRVPVLARSSGDVIDGHLRLKAAQKLAISEIPVIVCDDWTEAQVKAFRRLVNRSVTMGCSLSELQEKLLVRHFPAVVLLLDSDEVKK